jgi:hypothetical protein
MEDNSAILALLRRCRFASRRNIIEELDVRATLETQDGLPICSAECILGE